MRYDNNMATAQQYDKLVDYLLFAVAGAFFMYVGSLVYFARLPLWILLFYVAVSVWTLRLYVKDKAAARQQQWRTPEVTLHFWALIGGWVGALVAQRLLHHKSRKQSFQFWFWFTVMLNLAGLISLTSSNGSVWLAKLDAWITPSAASLEQVGNDTRRLVTPAGGRAEIQWSK